MTNTPHGQVPEALIYAELPKHAATGLGEEYESFDQNGKPMGKAYQNLVYYTDDQMRAFADATHALRTPEQRTSLFEAFRVKVGAAPQPSTTAQAEDSVPAVDASPSAASITWIALRDLTDPLGEVGVKIIGHVRIYAQRQYEAGRAASAPADSVTAPAGGEIDRLRAQVASLTRDCDRQASKIAELIADLKFQEEKHREDRARLQAIYEHQRGECWYWQGDGQDHLESLCNTLPVVIRADQLRALVSIHHAQAADSVLEDAARLDWLALAGPVSVCVVIDRPHDSEVEVATDDVTGYGKTLREALDAARKQGGAA